MFGLKKVAAIGLLISSGFILSACKPATTTTSNSTSGAAEQQASGEEAQDSVTIIVSDDGASPSQATVKSGGKITWTNNSKVKVQIASDPHPIHTSNKELSKGEFVIELEPSASATVTVSKVGTWGYHDHLNPAQRGKVIVK
ncbi:cupredoxin domain-containing protein [Candidatus Curtissbacteria bacterium]|nr:cupredoxin domain-containing protein [Candidatus Curtissbacteria bacterium]